MSGWVGVLINVNLNYLCVAALKSGLVAVPCGSGRRDCPSSQCRGGHLVPSPGTLPRTSCPCPLLCRPLCNRPFVHHASCTVAGQPPGRVSREREIFSWSTQKLMKTHHSPYGRLVPDRAIHPVAPGPREDPLRAPPRARKSSSAPSLVFHPVEPSTLAPSPLYLQSCAD